MTPPPVSSGSQYKDTEVNIEANTSVEGYPQFFLAPLYEGCQNREFGQFECNDGFSINPPKNRAVPSYRTMFKYPSPHGGWKARSDNRAPLGCPFFFLGVVSPVMLISPCPKPFECNPFAKNTPRRVSNPQPFAYKVDAHTTTLRSRVTDSCEIMVSDPENRPSFGGPKAPLDTVIWEWKKSEKNYAGGNIAFWRHSCAEFSLKIWTQRRKCSQRWPLKLFSRNWAVQQEVEWEKILWGPTIFVGLFWLGAAWVDHEGRLCGIQRKQSNIVSICVRVISAPSLRSRWLQPGDVPLGAHCIRRLRHDHSKDYGSFCCLCARPFSTCFFREFVFGLGDVD